MANVPKILLALLNIFLKIDKNIILPTTVPKFFPFVCLKTITSEIWLTTVSKLSPLAAISSEIKQTLGRV